MAARSTFPETTSNGIPLITIGLTQVPRFVSEVVIEATPVPVRASERKEQKERREAAKALVSALSETLKL